MWPRRSLGSSIVRSQESSGKLDQSAGLRAFRRNVDFSQEIVTSRPMPSNVTAASGSVFTMLVRTLPETTVSPLSSTLAGTRWRMEIVRLLVWNSSWPSEART